MNWDFELGVSSASAQIEGGMLNHNWNDWYKKGHIKDGADPMRANDHWNRWKEDIYLMGSMGIGHYRLSVEWARMEPERGKYDEAAAGQYREMLAYMKENNIKPLVTLHHFTHPMWFEELGGFANPNNIPVFLGFVAYAVKQFGGLADAYVTINEPNVFATLGYFTGIFPPGRKSLREACKVMSVMASCHVRAYGLIHKLRREMGFTQTKVGFAHHARVFAEKNKYNPWHPICRYLVERMFQKALAKACLFNRFTFPLRRYGAEKPENKTGNKNGAGKGMGKQGIYADFTGLNYYTRSAVSGLGEGTFARVPVNDLGWEIYPEGIARCAKELHDLAPLPIYITENGTCDNNDAFRCRYIFEHLKALQLSGLPVERYYHWCFTDNFEWCEGESARFGLVHVNYETQKRSIKKSGRFYSEMIKNNGVTEEMLSEYVNGEEFKCNPN